MMQVPEPETRTVVRNAFREVIAIGFTVVVAVLYLGSVIEQPYVQVELQQMEYTAVWGVFMLYVISGGFLTFGKRTIEDAAEMWRNIRSGDS